MRYLDSIFSSLLKPIDRRAFKGSVARHKADAYDKSFASWDHLVALIYAQLSGASGLRGLVCGWNAHAHQHYHLGVGALARSTLSDANSRRPVAVFAELFEALSAQLDRRSRADGKALLRLIDATPVPLGKLCQGAAWNGRIRGMKMHLLYDPRADRPCHFDITPANVNDIAFGRAIEIERGATYVYDKAYCHYGWWAEIAKAGAVFVTRPKSNARWRTLAERALDKTEGDGFRVLADREVALASKGDSKLAIPLRLVTVQRDDAKPITLLTNDMHRTALEIGDLYKARWQIELLFRWIKQHLQIKTFLGRSENAIRLQITAAMIAFTLLRLAARRHCVEIKPIRLAQLVAACLFVRKPFAKIDKPPPVNPSKPKPLADPKQAVFQYA
jgi:putative transposase